MAPKMCFIDKKCENEKYRVSYKILFDTEEKIFV